MQQSPEGSGKTSTVNDPQTSSCQGARRKPEGCTSPLNLRLRTSTNTSVPTQGQEVPSPQSLSSYFREANNVVVNRGQFSSAMGNQTVLDFTINVNNTEIGDEHPPRMVTQPTSMDQDALISDKVTNTGWSTLPGNILWTVLQGLKSRLAAAFGRLTMLSGHRILGCNLTPQVSVAAKTSNEIYESLLSPKKRGFALWIPEPNKNLPFPYQRKGIQIGDVGIITPDGSFSFIFNICVSRDDPVNPRSLPDDFAPICPPIDPIDIRRLAVFKSDSYLASTSIEKAQDDTTSPGLSFRTAACEGAILTMPEGALSQDLENLPRFRDYAVANVHKWYKYINGPRGREAKNGDVRLVVGCDKAASWGMAALSNVNQNCQLRFKPLDEHASDPPIRGYTWEYSGMAEVRVGPDLHEIEELRREDPDDSNTRNKYLNQCLFVRTLNVTLSDEDWGILNNEISVDYRLDSTASHGTGTSSHSPNNRDSQSDTTQSPSTSGNFGIQRKSGDNSERELTSLEAGTSRLIFSSPPTATSCHPSRILNETLLKRFPTAKMVVTQDEDWYPCVQEDVMIDAEQIFASQLTTKHIREDNGVVYLEPKVSREAKYFADLEELSIELQKSSSNLEQYFCGADPAHSARWNEILFLLELCYDALLHSNSDADQRVASRKAIPPDARRIKEVEFLLGSLLIDELFLDNPGAFESMYALRPRSQGIKRSGPLSRSQKLPSIMWRVPPCPSITRKGAVSEIRQNGLKELLSFSSYHYLRYLELKKPRDLKRTIEYFRQQKFPEREFLDSLRMSPVEENTRRGSLPGSSLATRLIDQLYSYMRGTTTEKRIESHMKGHQDYSGSGRARLSPVFPALNRPSQPILPPESNPKSPPCSLSTTDFSSTNSRWQPLLRHPPPEPSPHRSTKSYTATIPPSLSTPTLQSYPPPLDVITSAPTGARRWARKKHPLLSLPHSPFVEESPMLSQPLRPPMNNHDVNTNNDATRDLVRTAIATICREMLTPKPPLRMSRTVYDIKAWEEVVRRVTVLKRNLEPTSGTSPSEERERKIFIESLRDGYVLCQLMNNLRWSSVILPDAREDGVVRNGNITKFLAACASYGMADEDLFLRDDLMEGRREGVARVARTVMHLVEFAEQDELTVARGRT